MVPQKVNLLAGEDIIQVKKKLKLPVSQLLRKLISILFSSGLMWRNSFSCFDKRRQDLLGKFS